MRLKLDQNLGARGARKCPKCGGQAYPRDSLEGAAIAKHFDGKVM